MYTGIYAGKRGKVKNSPVLSAAAGVAYANYINCMFATVHAMIPEPYTFVQAFRLPRLLSHRHATKKKLAGADVCWVHEGKLSKPPDSLKPENLNP